VLVRIEMLRKERTYELLITQHRPGEVCDGKRPVLKQRYCFGVFTVDWSWTCPERTRAKRAPWCRRSIHWPVRK